jgi:hypothetical protein
MRKMLQQMSNKMCNKRCNKRCNERCPKPQALKRSPSGEADLLVQRTELHGNLA